jgi:hypothetical protein
MTEDLSDDEDQMPMDGEEGGAGMQDEDDDLEMEIDPRAGRGGGRSKGNRRGRTNAGDGQRKQSAAYDDDGDF